MYEVCSEDCVVVREFLGYVGLTRLGSYFVVPSPSDAIHRQHIRNHGRPYSRDYRPWALPFCSIDSHERSCHTSMADTLTSQMREGTSLNSLNVASGSSTPHQPVLPQLPYSLREHKKSIAIIWSLLLLDATIMPLTLFYPLWYATNLDPAYIFAVTTGVFGIISGMEWCYRSWQLWKKEEVRPFGGKRNGVSEASDAENQVRCNL